MFGKFGDMMGSIQDAKRQIEETKERLNHIIIGEKSNDGKIEVDITAARRIKDLKIDRDLLEDPEELADKIVILLNKALEEADTVNEAEMKGAASGMMNMPGMDKLFK